MFRHTPVNEQVTQPLENVFTREPLGDIDRQALPSELVHDRQHPDRPAIGGTIRDEVIAPDVIAMGRPQPDA
jgi:hypothetical protein